MFWTYCSTLLCELKDALLLKKNIIIGIPISFAMEIYILVCVSLAHAVCLSLKVHSCYKYVCLERKDPFSTTIGSSASREVSSHTVKIYRNY